MTDKDVAGDEEEPENAAEFLENERRRRMKSVATVKSKSSISRERAASFLYRGV